MRAKVSRMYGSEYGAFYARRRSVWQSHESRQYNHMVKTVFLSIILVLQTYILWSRTIVLEKQVTRRVNWLSVVSKGGNAPPRLALRQFSFQQFQTQNYAAALRSKIHSRGWRYLSKGSWKLFLSGAAQESWVFSRYGSRFWVVINIWWIPNHLSQEFNSLISISVQNSRVFATRRVHITSFVGTSNLKKLTLNLKRLHCTGCRCLTACWSFRLGFFSWALRGSQGLARIFCPSWVFVVITVLASIV